MLWYGLALLGACVVGLAIGGFAGYAAGNDERCRREFDATTEREESRKEG